MNDTRTTILKRIDGLLAFALAGLLLGTSLAFGGATWWAPAAIAGLCTLLVVGWIVRATISGSWRVLKSPLTAIGAAAVGLAAFQITPMPANVAAMVSPKAREVQTLGLLVNTARADDPQVVLSEPLNGRTPLTIDRPGTLRRLAGLLACLALFWVVSHYADRLNRLYLIWGCVVAAFLLNTSIAVVQLVGGVDGLYGFIQPGEGPAWAPSTVDAVESPGETRLRPVVTSPPTPHAWALIQPVKSPRMGTMMGGPGAFLALGSLGLPLALAVTLQLMAPRGSREGLWVRLAENGRGSLLILLYGASIVGAAVVGLIAGPRLGLPFFGAIVLVGLPSLFGTGLRWKGITLTSLTLVALWGGITLGEHWNEILPDVSKPSRVELATSRSVWIDSLRIIKDFPVIGTGLGSFASIFPYYKTRDAGSTTAMSSVLQWSIEAGAVGVGLVVAAGLWGLKRLPGAVRRVGSADRALVFGMIGAVACFVVVSTIHWTVELAAVALAASAVAGTCNRWLAGGTDLFVERA